MKKHIWRAMFEFVSIFVAVIAAFALNNWNDNRRDANTENKILLEISNGLEKDLVDIDVNIQGHKDGMAACDFFRGVIAGNSFSKDSLIVHYFNLTRDFLTVQNNAGYESLKSKGLELIQDDSLRLKIISLYEYDYLTLQKFEEEYQEMQFFNNYYKEFNAHIAPNFEVNESGIITGFQGPLVLEEAKKKELLLFLWKIQTNRSYIVHYYAQMKEKVKALRKRIGAYLKK